jgi:hypothetical protein
LIVNGLRGPVQRRTAALLFGLAFASAGHVARGDGAPQGASAPELVAARELFRQATEDVDAGRHAEALEKFRRVAAVKETANVRFNIARCEESLGRTGGALADFELAEREGSRDPNPQAADVAKLAHDRADALRPRVPRLGVTAPSPVPAGLTVTLDGSKLAVAALGTPLPVDPGAHVVTATAPGRAPFRASVSLAAGEAMTVPIAMGPGDGQAEGPSGSPSDAAGAASSSGPSRGTWGAVTLAASGALAVGSVAFLLLHDSAVSSVESACPGNRCPTSSQASVTSNESSARTDETLSVVFAAAAVVGTGVGLYLVLGAPSSPTAPSAVLTPGGISVRGRF